MLTRRISLKSVPLTSKLVKFVLSFVKFVCLDLVVQRLKLRIARITRKRNHISNIAHTRNK
jgi:hypothetical protein